MMCCKLGAIRYSSITEPHLHSGLGKATQRFQVLGCGVLSQRRSACPQETVVAGEEGGDMRFLLPGGPSPAALAALLSACRELDRAGASYMLAFLHLYMHTC